MSASPLSSIVGASSEPAAVVPRRSCRETLRHPFQRKLLKKPREWQPHCWSTSRSIATFLLSRSATSNSLKTDFERRRVSAALSVIEAVPRVSNVNTAYQRVADCLVFPPLTCRKPRAIIHFIGGGFIGAVPEVTYSLFIELLRQQNFLIIATPYNASLEHVVAAKLVYQKFQKSKHSLMTGNCHVNGITLNDITNLPVFSIGHSHGALLQLLIGCLFEEDLPKANAVISFCNKAAADADPYFEQLEPVIIQLASLIASSPLLRVSNFLTGNSLKIFFNVASTIVSPYDQENLQSLQNFVEQFSPALDQISKGASKFNPTPFENRKSIGNSYNVKNTLLVKYKVDPIDESDIIEDILKPAVWKLDGSLAKITIDGNHITPCVQDFRWKIGKVYTPFDAVSRLFRTAALSDIRGTIVSITNWLEQFL